METNTSENPTNQSSMQPTTAPTAGPLPVPPGFTSAAARLLRRSEHDSDLPTPPPQPARSTFTGGRFEPTPSSTVPTRFDPTSHHTTGSHYTAALSSTAPQQPAPSIPAIYGSMPVSAFGGDAAGNSADCRLMPSAWNPPMPSFTVPAQPITLFGSANPPPWMQKNYGKPTYAETYHTPGTTTFTSYWHLVKDGPMPTPHERRATQLWMAETTVGLPLETMTPTNIATPDLHDLKAILFYRCVYQHAGRLPALVVHSALARFFANELAVEYAMEICGRIIGQYQPQLIELMLMFWRESGYAGMTGFIGEIDAETAEQARKDLEYRERRRAAWEKREAEGKPGFRETFGGASPAPKPSTETVVAALAYIAAKNKDHSLAKGNAEGAAGEVSDLTDAEMVDVSQEREKNAPLSDAVQGAFLRHSTDSFVNRAVVTKEASAKSTITVTPNAETNISAKIMKRSGHLETNAKLAIQDASLETWTPKATDNTPTSNQALNKDDAVQPTTLEEQKIEKHDMMAAANLHAATSSYKENQGFKKAAGGLVALKADAAKSSRAMNRENCHQGSKESASHNLCTSVPEENNKLEKPNTHIKPNKKEEQTVPSDVSAMGIFGEAEDSNAIFSSSDEPSDDASSDYHEDCKKKSHKKKVVGGRIIKQTGPRRRSGRLAKPFAIRDVADTQTGSTAAANTSINSPNETPKPKDPEKHQVCTDLDTTVGDASPEGASPPSVPMNEGSVDTPSTNRKSTDNKFARHHSHGLPKGSFRVPKPTVSNAPPGNSTNPLQRVRSSHQKSSPDQPPPGTNLTPASTITNKIKEKVAMKKAMATEEEKERRRSLDAVLEPDNFSLGNFDTSPVELKRKRSSKARTSSQSENRSSQESQEAEDDERPTKKTRRQGTGVDAGFAMFFDKGSNEKKKPTIQKDMRQHTTKDTPEVPDATTPPPELNTNELNKATPPVQKKNKGGRRRKVPISELTPKDDTSSPSTVNSEALPKRRHNSRSLTVQKANSTPESNKVPEQLTPVTTRAAAAKKAVGPSKLKSPVNQSEEEYLSDSITVAIPSNEKPRVRRRNPGSQSKTSNESTSERSNSQSSNNSRPIAKLRASRIPVSEKALANFSSRRSSKRTAANLENVEEAVVNSDNHDTAKDAPNKDSKLENTRTTRGTERKRRMISDTAEELETVAKRWRRYN